MGELPLKLADSYDTILQGAERERDMTTKTERGQKEERKYSSRLHGV